MKRPDPFETALWLAAAAACIAALLLTADAAPTEAPLGTRELRAHCPEGAKVCVVVAEDLVYLLRTNAALAAEVEALRARCPAKQEHPSAWPDQERRT